MSDRYQYQRTASNPAVESARTRSLIAIRDSNATGRLFHAWKVLELLERRFIRPPEMAQRVSDRLGRPVTEADFWAWVGQGTDDDQVVTALAAVVSCDPDWLRGGVA